MLTQTLVGFQSIEIAGPLNGSRLCCEYLQVPSNKGGNDLTRRYSSKEIEQGLTGDLVHINTYITAEMDEDQVYNVALNDIGGTWTL